MNKQESVSVLETYDEAADKADQAVRAFADISQAYNDYRNSVKFGELCPDIFARPSQECIIPAGTALIIPTEPASDTIIIGAGIANSNVSLILKSNAHLAVLDIESCGGYKRDELIVLSSENPPLVIKPTFGESTLDITKYQTAKQIYSLDDKSLLIILNFLGLCVGSLNDFSRQYAFTIAYCYLAKSPKKSVGKSVSRAIVYLMRSAYGAWRRLL